MNPSRTVVADNDTDEQGQFEFRGLPPGAYLLTAHATVGERQYSAQQPIQVGASDVDGIELRPAPPMALNGVVRIEGSTNAKPTQVAIEVAGARSAVVKDDGTFAFRDLPPVVYHPIVRAPRDLFVKGIRCGNSDVAESGVDLTGGEGCDLVITVSANGGRIEGNVQNENPQPAEAATVTLIPQATGRTDLFQTTTPDASATSPLWASPPGVTGYTPGKRWILTPSGTTPILSSLLKTWARVSK